MGNNQEKLYYLYEFNRAKNLPERPKNLHGTGNNKGKKKKIKPLFLNGLRITAGLFGIYSIDELSHNHHDDPTHDELDFSEIHFTSPFPSSASYDRLTVSGNNPSFSDEKITYRDILSGFKQKIKNTCGRFIEGLTISSKENNIRNMEDEFEHPYDEREYIGKTITHNGKIIPYTIPSDFKPYMQFDDPGLKEIASGLYINIDELESLENPKESNSKNTSHIYSYSNNGTKISPDDNMFGVIYNTLFDDNKESGEFWIYPRDTLKYGGDCEDISILMMNLFSTGNMGIADETGSRESYIPSKLVLLFSDSEGHALVLFKINGTEYAASNMNVGTSAKYGTIDVITIMKKEDMLKVYDGLDPIYQINPNGEFSIYMDGIY